MVVTEDERGNNPLSIEGRRMPREGGPASSLGNGEDREDMGEAEVYSECA
jgi:hypothetical protein